MRRQILFIFIAALLIAVAGTACSMLGRHRLPAIQLDLEIIAAPADREATAKQIIAIIERRLNALGVTADVKSQGNLSDGRIVVNLWNAPDIDRVKRVITETGKLELAHVISHASPAPCQTYPTKEEAIAALDKQGKIPADRRVLPLTDRTTIPGGESGTAIPTKWVIVESPAIIDGTDFRNARAINLVGLNDSYQIVFSLGKTGADKFSNWTATNINEYLAVILNDEVKSAAFIKSQIFDTGEISGRFNKQSAEELALILRAGSLPFPVKIVGQSFFQQKQTFNA